MASACKIPVNKAQIVHDRDGEPGLLVTRFDRENRGREKLHQEDGCQLLDSPPGRKYHLSLRDIADRIAAVTTAPVVEIERLLRLIAFSYLIGNGDLHAKNISVLWSKTVRLSPAYDLLSTLPYKSLEERMALKLMGKDRNLRREDFVEFGRLFGVSEAATAQMLATLCDHAKPWIERLAEIGFDRETTESLQTKIAERIAQLSQ